MQYRTFKMAKHIQVSSVTDKSFTTIIIFN